MPNVETDFDQKTGKKVGMACFTFLLVHHNKLASSSRGVSHSDISRKDLSRGTKWDEWGLHVVAGGVFACCPLPAESSRSALFFEGGGGGDKQTKFRLLVGFKGLLLIWDSNGRSEFPARARMIHDQLGLLSLAYLYALPPCC